MSHFTQQRVPIENIIFFTPKTYIEFQMQFKRNLCKSIKFSYGS